MGLLRTAPTERIRSLPELVAMAHAMETEAAERYAELAHYMRRIGNPATALVLDALSAEERGHVEAVARLSQASIGRAPDLADIAWDRWPEVFDAEDLPESRLVTPYQALSVAVRNEERAFAFWSYMSADAEDPDVRREAERMAQEELQHVAKLRKERRRAFRGVRSRPPAPMDPAAFTAAALETSRELQALSEALAVRLAALEHPAAGTMRSLAAEQAGMTGRAAGAVPQSPRAVAGPPADASAEMLIAHAIERYEAAVEQCLRAADEIDDEDAVRRAQKIAEVLLRNLAALREWEPESPPTASEGGP